MSNYVFNPIYVGGALFYSILGLIIFALGFYLIDRLTPYQLWTEIIEKQNLALSIVVGSVSIAVGLIISSAIH